MSLLFTASTLAMPTAWPHYFVHLPLCQVVALARVTRLEGGVARGSVVTLVLVSAGLAGLPTFAWTGGYPRYAELGLLGVANLLLLTALDLIVVLDAMPRR